MGFRFDVESFECFFQNWHYFFFINIFLKVIIFNLLHQFYNFILLFRWEFANGGLQLLQNILLNFFWVSLQLWRINLFKLVFRKLILMSFIVCLYHLLFFCPVLKFILSILHCLKMPSYLLFLIFLPSQLAPTPIYLNWVPKISFSLNRFCLKDICVPIF